MSTDGLNQRIGCCIYCGSKEPGLTKEHVVPKGLNGNVTLGEASCRRCADITKRFEGHILHEVWQGCRAQAGLGSRHKENRPLYLPLAVQRGQSWSVECVPIPDHIALAAFPIFVPPAHLTGANYTEGITLAPSAFGCVVHERWQTLLQRLGANGWGFVQVFRPVDFARLIAKVAYGMAIYLEGYDYFETRYVVPCILGQRDDVGRWVGTASGPFHPPGEGLHEVSVFPVGQEAWAYVRLFAKAGTPTYLVVLGTLASSAGAPGLLSLQGDR